MNGLKIPLLINSGTLVAALIAAVTLWVQQGVMAEDIEELKRTPVTESRIVAIEIELKNLKRAVEDLGD